MDDPSEYIDFEARYRGWVSERRLAIAGSTTALEIAAHLASIRNAIEGNGYSMLGIRTGVLDSYAAAASAGLQRGYASAQALAARLDGAEAKRAVSEACPDGRLAPMARAYLSRKAMSAIGVYIGLSTEAIGAPRAGKGAAPRAAVPMQSDLSEYIDFMAKRGGWVSIKRLGIRPDTRPEAVVFHMAGIRATIDAKAYSLCGIPTAGLDECAARLSSGAKGGLQGFSGSVAKLASDDAMNAVKSAAAAQATAPIAENYLVYRLAVGSGVPPGLDQGIMSKIWKDLKIKKPLGAGRGKKAAQT